MLNADVAAKMTGRGTLVVLIMVDGEFYTVIRRMYMDVCVYRYVFMYMCTYTDHGRWRVLYGDV